MPFDRDLRALLMSLEKASRSPTEAVRRRLANIYSQRQSEDSRAMAERHVRDGEARVARQREVVLQLRAQGRDSRLAEALLAQFEDILAAHKVHLQRLKSR